MILRNEPPAFQAGMFLSLHYHIAKLAHNTSHRILDTHMHVDFNCMHIFQHVHVSTPFEPMQQAIIPQTAVFSKFGPIIDIYPLLYLILIPEHD
jgi:hypothetical protein